MYQICRSPFRWKPEPLEEHDDGPRWAALVSHKTTVQIHFKPHSGLHTVQHAMCNVTSANTATHISLGWVIEERWECRTSACDAHLISARIELNEQITAIFGPTLNNGTEPMLV